MKSIRLPPLPFQTNERLRAIIEELFRVEIYDPLMEELALPASAFKNSVDILLEAVSSGRIAYYRGQFKGRFSLALSRELERIGARWDRKQGSFAVPASKLPHSLRIAISIQESRLDQQAERIQAILNKLLPEQIADRLRAEDFFDRALWRTEEKIGRQVRAIAVQPKLSDEDRARVALEYTTNLKLSIKGWADVEILRLRARVEKVATSGTRYESLVKTIQRSYGVSQRKAKFLARQETNLMLCQFQESRYRTAGSHGYFWRCVHGNALHPVRPLHRKLDGKFIRWDAPPVVNSKGDRKHAGEDYNCRCGREVVIEF